MLERKAVECAGRYQPPVIFGNLALQPFVVKLAAARAVGQRGEDEFAGMRLGVRDDIDPANGVGKRLRGVRLDGAVKESLDAFEYARAGELCAEIGGQAFLPVEDAWSC